MARIARNSIDIEAVKIQILHEAKLIIGRDGFSQFSMRKLAKASGMTATNIYNYFSNKDEIYLRVQQAGFDMLQNRFDEAAKNCDGPANLMLTFIKAYVGFGIENPEYYEVMLGSNTPKYADYVGTELEGVASQEKQSALGVSDTTAKVLVGLYGLSEAEAKFKTVQLWTSLHGLVSLHNNRVLQEIELDLQEMIERICTELLLSITNINPVVKN